MQVGGRAALCRGADAVTRGWRPLRRAALRRGEDAARQRRWRDASAAAGRGGGGGGGSGRGRERGRGRRGMQALQGGESGCRFTCAVNASLVVLCLRCRHSQVGFNVGRLVADILSIKFRRRNFQSWKWIGVVHSIIVMMSQQTW